MRLVQKKKQETENNIIAEIRQEREYKEGTGIINKIKYGVYVPIEVEKKNKKTKRKLYMKVNMMKKQEI